MSPRNRGPVVRLAGSAALAVTLVVGALALVDGPSWGGREGTLLGRYDASKAARLEARPHRDRPGGPLHVDAPGTAPHDHFDPTTKNALSRSGDTQAVDPTTDAEKAASASYVAGERALPDPTLRTVPVMQQRRRHPQDRYAMANGCYRLTRGGRPLFFRPTDLGQYLLYTADRRFVSPTGLADQPSDDTVWTARRRGGRTIFRSGAGTLRDHGRTAFRLTRTHGCTAYPESQIDVSGRPHAGTTPYQEVRGFVDAHTHGMAFEFLGGSAHCGKPWDRFGAPYALVDCPDHTATGGFGGVLEDFLSGSPHHDPVGWPTFKDWPAPESLTHEGTYYRWLERSWRGGQRIFVNLLVENNQLCEVYPLHKNATYAECKDMPSLHRQARDMYQMQDYIDAQFGGPGKGFYRIVKNPFQARRVVNAGKMAVIMGIETSVPFGCTFKAGPTGDQPAGVCSPQHIDRELTRVRGWGVRQMELVNKFDNALAGVAGDNGETGAIVNNANFKETGSYWDMRQCEPADGLSHDKDQYAAPEISPEQQDALFGAIGELTDLSHVATPAYPPPDHCNSRGLTTLGQDTINGLAKRHMIFDPDHMSVAARNASLDQLEAMHYSGVVSSHSWATPDAYPRIYRLGGFITPYAGDSTGFVDKWRAHLGWADRRYYWGIGYGADMNGLGAQGDPRGTDVPNPVTYPFTGLGGVTVHQQHAGQRVYDINADGVAQYGLYPDWIQDLREVADAQHAGDGNQIFDDMARGAEAYLQMWERAQGIAPDSCRNPEQRKPASRVQKILHRGMTTRAVMKAVGQPYERLGDTYTFCARTGAQPSVRMQVVFDRGGRVTGVRRAA